MIQCIYSRLLRGMQAPSRTKVSTIASLSSSSSVVASLGTSIPLIASPRNPASGAQVPRGPNAHPPHVPLACGEREQLQVIMGDIGVQYHALKIFQLNTAKVTASGNALARIMGAHRHSLAFITEPPIAFNKVCGFPAGAFNVLHHPKEVKRCRAAIVASKGVDVMALPS